MRDIERVRRLSVEAHRYPEIGNLVDSCMRELDPKLRTPTAYQIVSEVFAGLMNADIRGLISTGDEHEWATVAMYAHARAEQAQAEADAAGAAGCPICEGVCC
jgi:hypothetical protein